MSLDGAGIGHLKLMLQRLAAAPDVANAELKVCAQEMAGLAKRMAPVDEGNLEEAIKVRFEGTQGAGGRFVKGGGRYAVYIDGGMPIDGRSGKLVGDYAWIMHEHLTPVGPMNLGPKSQAKQDADSSIVVGGKFLERAGEMMSAQIHGRLASVIFKHVEGLDFQ